jgi:hypothetical protein
MTNLAGQPDWHRIADERSAEIIRLRATNAALEKALERIKNMNTDTFEAMGPLLSCVAIATAALTPTPAPQERQNG